MNPCNTNTCGDHGYCWPLTGGCACDIGWDGPTCNTCARLFTPNATNCLLFDDALQNGFKLYMPFRFFTDNITHTLGPDALHKQRQDWGRNFTRDAAASITGNGDSIRVSIGSVHLRPIGAGGEVDVQVSSR